MNDTDIDLLIHDARAQALAIVAKKERHFVESVVARGAATRSEAQDMIAAQRQEIAITIEDELDKMRAWLRQER